MRQAPGNWGRWPRRRVGARWCRSTMRKRRCRAHGAAPGDRMRSCPFGGTEEGEDRMSMPRPDEANRAYFHSLLPEDPRITVRPMFGNLAGFVNGNMFTGIFGSSGFVHLVRPALQDHQPARAAPGVRAVIADGLNADVEGAGDVLLNPRAETHTGVIWLDDVEQGVGRTSVSAIVTVTRGPD